MRPVIAKSELESLIPALPKLPLLSDVPADGKLAAAYYREILAQHNCRRLLQLCKTLHAKQTELARNRKSVNATDLRNWKTAEEMVYGEFGFVLGMCAGAILNAQIPRVVYGAKNDREGAAGTLIDLFSLPRHQRPAVVSGVLEEDCASVLTDFFRRLRRPDGQT